jgi:hypothetical protein
MTLRNSNQNSKTPGKIQSALVAVAVLAILGSLSGCGNMKTNPTADYKELSDSTQPHNQKPRDQKYIDSSIFQIEVDRNIVFVQGKSATYYFKPRFLLGGVNFELQALGLPDGASFSRVKETEHAGQYRLTWTPRAGILTDQELERVFKFQVAIKVNKSPDANAAETLKKIGHPREFEFRILRADEQPVVEKVEMAVHDIQEGDALAFTVIVKDTGAGDRSPRLLVADELGASHESTKLDASRLVRIDSHFDVLGSGRYRFTGRLETKNVELPGKAPVVPARFVLIIGSHSGLPSVDEVVEVRITRKAAPAPALLAAVSPAALDAAAPSLNQTPTMYPKHKLAKAKAAPKAKAAQKTKVAPKTDAKKTEPKKSGVKNTDAKKKTDAEKANTKQGDK